MLPGTAGSLWAIDHGPDHSRRLPATHGELGYAREAIGDGERADNQALLITLSRSDEPSALPWGRC